MLFIFHGIFFIPFHSVPGFPYTPKRGRPARFSKALQIDNEKLSILKTKGLIKKQDSDQPINLIFLKILTIPFIFKIIIFNI